MYNFREVTESGATNTSMSIQSIFNDFNLDEELTDLSGSFRTLTVSGRSGIENDITLIPVTGMDGAWENEKNTIRVREIVVKCLIEDDTNKGMVARFEKLKSLLVGSKQELKFSDDDATYYATLSMLEVPEEESKRLIINIIFTCSDPFKYGPEQSLNNVGDEFVVDNKGTAEADPIFELTATKKATFAMVSNQNEKYNLIGRPTTVTEEIVDTRRLLFTEDGSTINDWTKVTDNNNIDGGTVSGAFGTDGAGITVPNYGSGSGWFGPAAMKEITPVNDFEVNAHFQLRTTSMKQTGRVEVYLFDENMNVLGKMGVMDNIENGYVKKGEARYGPFVGNGKKYLISSQNYQYDWDYFFGMVRIRRVGNELEFYITRIATNTNHVYSLRKVLRNIEPSLMGKLKYVQIHIGTHDTRAYSAKFFTVSAFELLKETVDETPYILYPGDVVTFDHKDGDILVNGEPRNDLKNFGSSFFTLEKGMNTLLVTPEDSFNTKVTYRDKYL